MDIKSWGDMHNIILSVDVRTRMGIYFIIRTILAFSHNFIIHCSFLGLHENDFSFEINLLKRKKEIMC